jgi:hypothetical protein
MLQIVTLLAALQAVSSEYVIGGLFDAYRYEDYAHTTLQIYPPSIQAREGLFSSPPAH